jgi:hypothetical protein
LTPWISISGALIFATCVIGDSWIRASLSLTRSPYSLIRRIRRYGAVFIRNVVRFEMPTFSTPASYAPAKYVMPISVE